MSDYPFLDEVVKLKKIEITPKDADHSKTRRVVAIAEQNNKLCLRVQPTYKNPFGIPEEPTDFRMVVTRWMSKLEIETVLNLNSIPLHMIRQLSTFFKIEGVDLKEMEFVSKREITPYNGSPIYQKFRNVSAQQMLDGFHFVYPCRRIEPQQEVLTDPKIHCKDTLTYWKRQYFEYSEGHVPAPRLEPVITYIPEDELYIVFGGLVATQTLSRRAYDEAFACLRRSEENCKTSSEDLKSLFDQSFFYSDEVWKYHVTDEKWELLLPAAFHGVDFVTSYRGRTLTFPRPNDTRVVALHHFVRKKIYYIFSGNRFERKHYDYLFEYDYLSNIFQFVKVFFRKRDSDGNFESGCVIDYSNDTLILPACDLTSKYILVVCLETYAIQWVRLEENSYISKDSSGDTLYGKLGFVDNYKTLVITELYPSESYVAYIDWESVKRKVINPFFKQRSLEKLLLKKTV